ncbi:hypothetical protein COCNU_scaffold020587G000010 [Cocos nucifera]|nr:hypothetical protein [Cocos nucifera]
MNPADSDGSLGKSGATLGGLQISDRVAEGVLICLDELLKKYHVGSVNQFSVITYITPSVYSFNDFRLVLLMHSPFFYLALSAALKALYVSKSLISVAAGSMGSIEHAVHGLTESLIIVLNDEENLYGLEMSINDIYGSLKESSSIQSALEDFRHLPVSSQIQSIF